MGTRADEIRDDIARTRENLGETIDAVEDRVSPRRMAARGRDRVRRKMHNAKEKVMGSVDSTKDKVMGTVDSQQVEDQIKGNPIAAGLIAFGAGALVASLLPADRSARELAEKAGPVVEQAKAELKEVGGEIGRSAGESAKESAHRLQDEAKTSAEHVKDETKTSAEHVKEETRRSSGGTTYRGGEPYRDAEGLGREPYPTENARRGTYPADDVEREPYPAAGEIRREAPDERTW